MIIKVILHLNEQGIDLQCNNPDVGEDAKSTTLLSSLQYLIKQRHYPIPGEIMRKEKEGEQNSFRADGE